MFRIVGLLKVTLGPKTDKAQETSLSSAVDSVG